MKINDFLCVVLEKEKGSVQVNIAQASELFKIMNKMLLGIPYLLVRLGLVRKCTW